MERSDIMLERNAAGSVINHFDRSVGGRLIRSIHHGWCLHNVRGTRFIGLVVGLGKFCTLTDFRHLE
ncbi:MAG: hypothetical protein FWC78_06835 [Defluviitaleaceae bacterium]|nr:hypothetical protein [Defluviitaleaceae bacterium]